jgi:hypothetical protein
LIPGTVSTGIIFAFTCMCTHFFAPYSPSYPLSPHPPRNTGANLYLPPQPWQDLFHPPVLQFCRR